MAKGSRFRNNSWIAYFTMSKRKPVDEVRLLPLTIALCVTLVSACTIVVLSIYFSLTLFDVHQLKRQREISSSDLFNMLKVAFAVVAGIGGVIALVVSYRKQRIAETVEGRERFRLFNERFVSSSEQLGSENPAVRLAGVYSMASLADDWTEHRQTCVDVLCAYMRIPHSAIVDSQNLDALLESLRTTEWRAEREVRLSIIRTLTERLKDSGDDDNKIGWRNLRFDFTGALFDGGDFSSAQFVKSEIHFDHAIFVGPTTFSTTSFIDCELHFSDARFMNSQVIFGGAKFVRSPIWFARAKLSGGIITFVNTIFSMSGISFFQATFASGNLEFYSSEAESSLMIFDHADFQGATLDLRGLAGSTVALSLNDKGEAAVPTELRLPEEATIETSPR
ncbi:hypothetical protein AB0J35_28210 [Nonomuraea angiospora]|uniref:pentapeptide repeat-containing protein n=1 Tax=Nonomuraea angiospora TaxID=46172 RepID=UPI003429C8F4